MTVRDIRLFGDPVLREVCRGVTDFGPALARLVTDLRDTCRQPGRAGAQSSWPSGPGPSSMCALIIGVFSILHPVSVNGL